jgi:hypothetical protein
MMVTTTTTTIGAIMNRLQFERALEAFADSMLEVLDADGSQCDAWNRKGHDLIHAFAVARFEDDAEPETAEERGARWREDLAAARRPAGSVRAAAGTPLEPARIVHQCSTPRLGFPSTRDPEDGTRCPVCGDYGMPGCPIMPSGLCAACEAVASH